MGRLARAAAVAAAAAVLVAAAGAPGGVAAGGVRRHPKQRQQPKQGGGGESLVGVFRSVADATNCSLLAIDPTTGFNTTVAAVDVCVGTSQTYPAFSSLDPVSNTIRVAVSTSPAIVAYDVTTGAVAARWPLPEYNGTDAWLGLVTLPAASGGVGTTYLVTMYTVLQLAPGGGALTRVAAVNLPASGEVAAAPDGRIFVAAGSAPSLTIINAAAGFAVTTLTTTVSQVWDLQWSPAANALVVLGSYTLYYLPVDGTAAGTATKIWAVPDGPGYPRVNGISPAGDVFYFIDFASAYTVALPPSANGTVSVLTHEPFTGAPRAIGYPVWVA